MSDDGNSTIGDTATNSNAITTEGPLLESTSRFMLSRVRWPSLMSGDSTPDWGFPYGWCGIEFASYLSNKARHYQGQANHKKLYGVYEKKLPEERQQQLEKWNDVLKEHPELSQRIEKYLKQNGNEHTSSTASTSAVTGRNIDLHSRDVSPPSIMESQLPAERPAKRARLSEAQLTGTSLPTDRILVHAPLDAAKSLLPPDLFEDIVREENAAAGEKYVAGIIMQFTNGYDDTECKMTLYIKPEAVSHYTQKWFGVRLELRDGLRYVRIAGSATVVMAQGLSGFDPLLLESEFGTEIARAIMASPTYQKEVQQKKGGTQAVLMMISLLATEPAQLMLTMRFYEGGKIREKLYPT